VAEENKKNIEGLPESQAPAMDEASSSLAAALRTSFRVLAFIILLLIVIFLAQGIFQVQSDQKIIILRFGKTDSSLVKEHGMHFAWPKPIDEVVRIWVQPRRLEMNTFWPSLTEEAKAAKVESSQGRPVYVEGAEDGYMLTGDMNILQAQWDITYTIKRDNLSLINYYTKIGDFRNEARLMRGILQGAVIRQLGRMKVFDAYPSGTASLQEAIKRSMVDVLQELNCGLDIEEITLREIRPPAKVKPAFDTYLSAKQKIASQVSMAETYRNNELIGAAGEVGVAQMGRDGIMVPGLGDEIQNWWSARKDGNKDAMEQADKRIQELFSRVGGDAQNAIAEARAYKTTVVETAKSASERLNSLLQRTDEELTIYLAHARIEVLQDVLKNCYEKFVYQPNLDGSKSTLDIRIGRDPELLREMKQIPESK
jgi:modulator of FtsH protease HflK